jgi:hypothetical protein
MKDNLGGRGCSHPAGLIGRCPQSVDAVPELLVLLTELLFVAAYSQTWATLAESRIVNHYQIPHILSSTLAPPHYSRRPFIINCFLCKRCERIRVAIVTAFEYIERHTLHFKRENVCHLVLRPFSATSLSLSPRTTGSGKRKGWSASVTGLTPSAFILGRFVSLPGRIPAHT